MKHQKTPTGVQLRPPAIVTSTVVTVLGLMIALASAAASLAFAAPPLPATLAALQKQGLSIVGTFPSPSGHAESGTVLHQRTISAAVQARSKTTSCLF